jgi:hypothetical protein
VLPPAVKARVAIEQASTFGWERYIGTEGRIIGMQSFGHSTPLKALQQGFGFTVEHVTGVARELLGKYDSVANAVRSERLPDWTNCPDGSAQTPQTPNHEFDSTK